jgi:hypothetical protein
MGKYIGIPYYCPEKGDNVSIIPFQNPGFLALQEVVPVLMPVFLGICHIICSRKRWVSWLL